MAFCGNCGNELKDGAKFCPKCGTSTNGTGNVQEPLANNSFVNEPEEEQIKMWQKIVCVLFWPAGAVLTIVTFIKKQRTLAKSALIYTVCGFVLAILLVDGLGGCSTDETGETEVFSVSPDDESDISSTVVSDIAEEGYNDGYRMGFQLADIDLDPDAKIGYTATYGPPSTPEEKQMYNIYKQNYERGYREGKRAGRE